MKRMMIIVGWALSLIAVVVTGYLAYLQFFTPKGDTAERLIGPTVIYLTLAAGFVSALALNPFLLRRWPWAGGGLKQVLFGTGAAFAILASTMLFTVAAALGSSFEEGGNRSAARVSYQAATLSRAPYNMLAYGLFLTEHGATARDWEDGLDLLKRVHATGYREAMVATQIGQLYLSGGAGFKPDPAAAIPWLTKGADGYYAPAAALLGHAYYRGEGVQRDRSEALRWFAQAAAGGDAESAYNAGVMLAAGDGAERDDAAATNYFQQAAAKSYPGAMLNLGVALMNGVGVARDDDQARAWLQRAAESESASVRALASTNLEALAARGR